MAFMTRRPPSLISWNDAELQPYLHGIFMPSLVMNLNNLDLNDLDENDSNSPDANGHHDGDSASMSSHDETFPTSDTSKGTSSEAKIVSGQKSTSSLMASVDTKPSFLASRGMESAHPAPDPNKPSSTSSTTTTTTAQNLASLQSNDRDQDPSRLNIPPRRVVFAIASGNSAQVSTSQPYKQKENYRHTLQIHSNGKPQLSTTPKPRLSLGAIPDMTIDTVPLRDLALASTMSYEAVLAATMVSPCTTADPIRDYGTIQSDFAFNESSKDRDGE